MKSGGTRNFISFITANFKILDHGGVLFVDEIENSFHILLVQHIIHYFLFRNPNNAQLIFTTHQGQLLNRTLLRPDQIWFTEKNNQQSRLYSLSDFDLSEIHNIEAAYYTGKFGATPYIEVPK